MDESVDGTLQLAQRNFADAVSDFVDRKPAWESGVLRWTPGLYSRMRSELLPGRAGQRGRLVPSSRTPCRTGVLDWLRVVDSTVAQWGGGGTVHALKDLARRQHRPQDTDRVNGWTALLTKWAAAAAELLRDAVVVVPLRGTACPLCGTRHVFRRRDGQTVRCTALVVSELGAQCLNCEAQWDTGQLEFLARLLDCPALPG